MCGLGGGGQGDQETSAFSCSARVCYLNQHRNVVAANMNTK